MISTSPRTRSLRLQRGRWWRAPWLDITIFVAVMSGLVWLAVHGSNSMGYNWQWYRVPQFLYRVVDGRLLPGPLTRGLLVTLELTAWSSVLALAIGLLTAVLRMSDSMAGKSLGTVYLEVIRNTPLLVQMYVFYFVLAPILGIGRFWVGVLTLAFFEGAFAAEIIRAGIEAVAKGQREASLSIGLSAIQSYRHVILPQAVPLMLPPLTGLIINLIKGSAIVSVIAIFDLTNEGRDIIADTFMSFEIWLTVAVMYLLLTVTLSISVDRLEKRIRRRG